MFFSFVQYGQSSCDFNIPIEGNQLRETCETYTMMLLMGMWINLTKNPMKPIMAKPIAVAIAIFWNSGKTSRNIHNWVPV